MSKILELILCAAAVVGTAFLLPENPEPVPVVIEQPAPIIEAPKEIPKEEVKPKPVRTLLCEATAYCEHGRTATGTQAGPGSIAVDPRIIPLGSRLYVEGYGEGWAVDTGSAIKGYIIDVWLPDNQTCREWGRRKSVEVQILEVPNGTEPRRSHSPTP